jgi:hypothetical protein
MKIEKYKFKSISRHGISYKRISCIRAHFPKHPSFWEWHVSTQLKDSEKAFHHFFMYITDLIFARSILVAKCNKHFKHRIVKKKNCRLVTLLLLSESIQLYFFLVATCNKPRGISSSSSQTSSARNCETGKFSKVAFSSSSGSSSVRSWQELTGGIIATLISFLCESSSVSGVE